MTDEEAASHALLRVAQTQFSFSKANTPTILRGPARATLFQYKRFLLSSMGLASNIVNERHPITGKLLPAKVRQAMFARWLSTFLVMGGLKGIPAWFVADLLAKLLWADDKKTSYDIHASLRKALGEKAADMIVMGLPAAAGVDISGSIVLFPKPYGRTAYEQLGAFAAGPTGSAIGDIVVSIMNKDVVKQSAAMEASLGFYASSPAAMQLGATIDLISGKAERRDAQGRLQFNQTVADKVRGMFGFRSVSQSMESIEYNKITVMADVVDSLLDDIASHIAAGDIVAAKQAVVKWNAMFPEVRLPTNITALSKDPSISRRAKRKADDRTLTTRQRRLTQQNDLVAEILVEREGFNEEDLD